MPERRGKMSKNITKMKIGEGLDEDQTDLKRLESMSDNDIDLSDIPELDKNFFKNAKVIMPSEKKHLSLRLDADVLAWLKSQGKGYQGRINAILRSYYEAHREDTPKS